MVKSRKKRKVLLYCLPGILLLALLTAVLQLTHTIQLGAKPTVTKLAPVIHNLPSPAVSSPSKVPASSNGVKEGTVSNSNTPTTSITAPESQWTTSQSGVITLKKPVNNSTITSGTIIGGTAQVSSVQYILIDNQAGMISQGTIPVTNGNFSASISFTPYSSSGRLDVFSSKPNGEEENLIEIQVNFK